MKLFTYIKLFVMLSVVMLTSIASAQTQELTRVVYVDKNGALFSVTLSGEHEIQLNDEELRMDTFDIATGNSNILIGSNGLVVFQAADNNFYSVSAVGGKPRQLTPNSTYSDVMLTSDGEYLIFLSASDGQLYSVRTTGGEPIALVPEGWIYKSASFETDSAHFITEDDQTVIATLQSARNVLHLFALPVAGGEGIQLSSRLASGGNVVSAFVRGEKVIYMADQEADETFGLFYVPITGGEATEVVSPLSTYTTFEITSDGEYLIYTLRDGFNEYATYVVPTMGGVSRKLEGEGDGDRVNGWQISPDGQYIYLLADNTRAAAAINLATGDRTTYEFGNICCAFTPDSSNILIAAQSRSGDGLAVYSGGRGDGHFIELSPANTSLVTDTSGYYLSHLEIQVSPDSRFAVYQSSDSTGIGQFYSSPLDRENAAVQLNSAPGSQNFARKYAITADSRFVVFLDNEEAIDFGDLYVVPIEGGEAIRVTTDDSQGVINFALTP